MQVSKRPNAAVRFHHRPLYHRSRDPASVADGTIAHDGVGADLTFSANGGFPAQVRVGQDDGITLYGHGGVNL